MARASSPYVYFTGLQLSNVRSFGDRQDLDLTGGQGGPARWTLILGDNGVGKTTLLQCLAMMRPVAHVPKAGPANAAEPKSVSAALFGHENADIFGLARHGQTNVSLAATLSTGRQLSGVGKAKHLTTKANFTVSDDDLDTIEQSHTAGTLEPLVIGYGAARHARYRKADSFDLSNDPTASLFDPSLELADAKTILEELDYAAYKKQPNAKKLLEAVKAALARLLPDVTDAAAIKLHGPATPGSKKQKTGVQVVTPYGEVPLGSLSLGYQTMTAWAVDLAWRLYQHYPEVAEPLKQPAIVLIDELDLHLHPRWQRELRAHISEAFPAVQFIATAHSPLLAQTYLDTNLAVVREEAGQAVIENDPRVVRTWRLDEVITSSLYEVGSPYSPAIEAELAKRNQLIQKKHLSPADRLELDRLEGLVASLSTPAADEDRRAMNLIKRAAQLLEPGAA